MTTAECWCGQKHPERTDDLNEAATTAGHAIIAALRIPQMVEWLNRRLPAAPAPRPSRTTPTFWRRYLFAVILPVQLIGCGVMFAGDNLWTHTTYQAVSAIAYSAWFVLTAPWVWAVLTRRARLG